MESANVLDVGFGDEGDSGAVTVLVGDPIVKDEVGITYPMNSDILADLAARR